MLDFSEPDIAVSPRSALAVDTNADTQAAMGV